MLFVEVLLDVLVEGHMDVDGVVVGEQVVGAEPGGSGDHIRVLGRGRSLLACSAPT